MQFVTLLTRQCHFMNDSCIYRQLNVSIPHIKLNYMQGHENNLGISSSPHLLNFMLTYRGADKSLARPTSRCILFDGEDVSFDGSLVIYVNSTNIPPIMIINRIYENQNILSL